MRKINGPSLVQDLGALAGLYRNVFWMMAHKEPWPYEWPRAGGERTAGWESSQMEKEPSKEALSAKR